MPYMVPPPERSGTRLCQMAMLVVTRSALAEVDRFDTRQPQGFEERNADQFAHYELSTVVLRNEN
jgi:hypothetical protein